MKIILSIFTFVFVFSFGQAQARPLAPSLKDIKPIERPEVKEEERRGSFREGLQLQSVQHREEFKEVRGLFKEESNIVPQDLSKEERIEFRNDRAGHREDLRKHIQEKRELFKEERQQLVGESKERVNRLLRGMTGKFTNALSKLDEIEERLNNLVEENDNIDIEESLNTAMILKSVAQDSVDEVMNNLVKEVDNEEGISKEILRELIEIAQSDIKNTWNAFREVITEIKTERIVIE